MNEVSRGTLSPFWIKIGSKLNEKHAEMNHAPVLS